MATRSRGLECRAGHHVPPHVSQVGRRLVRDRGRWCPRWRPLRAAGEDAHEFRKADDGADLGARDQAGLRAAAGGDDRDLLAQRATSGTMPGTRRMEPSSPSSPRNARPPRAAASTAPDAASTPMAIARSRPAPLLRTPDGARFTVMRLSGQVRRWTAARPGHGPATRARLVRQAHDAERAGRWRRAPRPRQGALRHRAAWLTGRWPARRSLSSIDPVTGPWGGRVGSGRRGKPWRNVAGAVTRLAPRRERCAGAPPAVPDPAPSAMSHDGPSRGDHASRGQVTAGGDVQVRTLRTAGRSGRAVTSLSRAGGTGDSHHVRARRPMMTTPLPPPPPLPPRMTWVPTLDGLRGLAVLAVVAFHAGHLDGGYLGVDLFFTVSGFLITRLILDDLGRGRFSLARFWGRRARRLLPALWLLLAVLMLFSPWLVERSTGLSLRRSVVATAIYIANWWQLSGPSSYWEAFGTPSPLNHTWSLAIEEQFYLLWPAVAVVVWARPAGRPGAPHDRRRRHRRVCGRAVAAVPARHRWCAVPGHGHRAASILIGCGAAILLWTRSHRVRRRLALAPPRGPRRTGGDRGDVVRRAAGTVAVPRRLPGAGTGCGADPRQQRGPDPEPAQPRSAGRRSS